MRETGHTYELIASRAVSINPALSVPKDFQQLSPELRNLAPSAKRTICIVKRRKGLLNLVLRGMAGGSGTLHIVPFYGPLPADPEDNRYWGEHSLAACGRKVRIRVAPTNLPSAAAEVAERLNYMPVETWRKDDLSQTCRQCLDRLDSDLRGLLDLNEPVMQVVR